MHPHKIHLGTFAGERLARRAADPAPTSPLSDLAGLVAMLVFCLCAGLVLAAAFLPALPQ